MRDIQGSGWDGDLSLRGSKYSAVLYRVIDFFIASISRFGFYPEH